MSRDFGGKKAFLIYSLLFLFSMKKSSGNHMSVCAYNANIIFLFYTFSCTHVHKCTRTPKKIRQRKRENPDRQIYTSTDRLSFIQLNYLIQKKIIMTNHKSFFWNRVFVSFRFSLGYWIFTGFYLFSRCFCLLTRTQFVECNEFYFKIVCWISILFFRHMCANTSSTKLLCHWNTLCMPTLTCALTLSYHYFFLFKAGPQSHWLYRAILENVDMQSEVCSK